MRSASQKKRIKEKRGSASSSLQRNREVAGASGRLLEGICAGNAGKRGIGATTGIGRRSPWGGQTEGDYEQVEGEASITDQHVDKEKLLEALSQRGSVGRGAED